MTDGGFQQQLAGKTVKTLPAGAAIDQQVVSAVYTDLVGSDSATPTGPMKAVAKQLTHSGP